MKTENHKLNLLIQEQNAPGVRFSEREMRIMDVAIDAQCEAEELLTALSNLADRMALDRVRNGIPTCSEYLEARAVIDKAKAKNYSAPDLPDASPKKAVGPRC